MTTHTEQRTDVLIGHINGCPVLAGYMDDGKLYEAALTWQGTKVVTDADGYIELFGGRDIGITDWRIVRDLVQCDVIEDLTALVLAHQWIAPIDGYTPEDEDPELVPAPPGRVFVELKLDQLYAEQAKRQVARAPLPTIAELEDQIIGLTSQIIRIQKEQSR